MGWDFVGFGVVTARGTGGERERATTSRGESTRERGERREERRRLA